MAASASDSPGSTTPPGRFHSPASSRNCKTTWSSASTATTTPKPGISAPLDRAAAAAGARGSRSTSSGNGDLLHTGLDDAPQRVLRDRGVTGDPDRPFG